MANAAKCIVFFTFITIKVTVFVEGNSDDTKVSRSSTVQSDKGSEYSHTANTEAVTPYDCYTEKHRLFCDCRSPIVLLPQDYNNKSGILHIPAFNTSYNISFYRIHDLDKGYVVVCEPKNVSEVDQSRLGVVGLVYISRIGLGVSMCGIFIHLVVFLLVPELRNMPGYNLACLCVTMFCGYASFLIGSLEIIKKASWICIAAAAATQFFLLSSFLWMNVISFSIFRSLWSSTSKLRVISTAFKSKTFLLCCLFSHGTSIIIVSLSLIIDKAKGIPAKYRPLFGTAYCWFNEMTALWIYFITPAFISIGVNVVFFGLSAYVIFSNRMKQTDDSKRGGAKRNLVLYSKLALITGMLWLSAVLARATDEVVLWYLFAVLNALQGFFIFLAFTFTPGRKHFFSRWLRSSVKHSLGASASTAKVSSSTGAYSESQI